MTTFSAKQLLTILATVMCLIAVALPTTDLAEAQEAPARKAEPAVLADTCAASRCGSSGGTGGNGGSGGDQAMPTITDHATAMITGGLSIQDGVLPFMGSLQAQSVGVFEGGAWHEKSVAELLTVVGMTPPGPSEPAYRQNHMCGVTLVAPEWALTAAHCIVASQVGGARVVKPANLSVLVGGVSLVDGAGELLPVAEVVFHPEFPNAHMYDQYLAGSNVSPLPDFVSIIIDELDKLPHDLAMLRLATPSSFEPVQLGSRAALPEIFSNFTALIGYGPTGEVDGADVWELAPQLGLVDIMAASACQVTLDASLPDLIFQGVLLPELLCHTRAATLGAEPCGTDSGGGHVHLRATGSSTDPAFEWVQVGVMTSSHGSGGVCGAADFGVSLSLSEARHWIQCDIGIYFEDVPAGADPSCPDS